MFISFKWYLSLRLIEAGIKEDGSQESPTVCYSCWTENSNSKSSKLLLSLLYYHMCAISMEWQTPLDQMGTIDPAALHFRLIVLEMRCTHSSIPALGRLYLFILVREHVSDKQQIFNSRLIQFCSKSQLHWSMLWKWLSQIESDFDPQCSTLYMRLQVADYNRNYKLRAMMQLHLW